MKNAMPVNFENEFPNHHHFIYLNHAAVGPWPKRTVSAVQQFANENYLYGASNYDHWLEIEQQCREHLKTLINAPSVDDIALLKNTSEALSIIAFGLNWKKGDNVVFAKREFPSNRIVWEALERYGVEARAVNIDLSDDPERQLVEKMDENTKLLSTSAVHYDIGLKMDLKILSETCKTNNTLFCVDAIQWLGAFPFDLKEINADFVVADGHKWMLSPAGVALFYCRSELREQLSLNQYGWNMIADPFNFNQQPQIFSNTAKRFECGSLNHLGIVAFEASLSLLLEVKMDEINNFLSKNINFLHNILNQIPNVKILSSNDKKRQSGIITFTSNIDDVIIYNHLLQNGIICAQRGNGIRLSPHFYTKNSDLQACVDIIDESINH